MVRVRVGVIYIHIYYFLDILLLGSNIRRYVFYTETLQDIFFQNVKSILRSFMFIGWNWSSNVDPLVKFFMLKFSSVILCDAMDSTFIVPKVSDNSLMSSMMSRLTAVEKQLSEADAKLKEKVGCISALHFCISSCSAYGFLSKKG